MDIQHALAEAVEFNPDGFERFSQYIEPALIEEALRVTDSVSLRRRRLPAERMVWLVIGLALFRNEPIWHIAHQLEILLPNGRPLVSPSAVVQARERLGQEPIRWLFERLAGHWGQAQAGAPWRGLRVLGVDGIVFRTPESEANAVAYARGSSQHGEGGWPQVRMACLMDLATHLVLASRFDSYAVGELTLARSLIRAVPEHSLTIFDRCYFSAAFLLEWTAQGAQQHWLMRAKKGLRYHTIRSLGDGDELVQMPVSAQARRAQPTLPEHWQARLISRTIKGKTYQFLTSLQDSKTYPAHALSELYLQRWEIELGYRELKQGLLQGVPVLRSKKPELIEQELYGALLAYNLLRYEMAQIAAEAGVAANRLSFHWTALAIITTLLTLPLQTPGAVPKRLEHLRAQCRSFLLPARRARTYPRTVKPTARKYPYRNKKCQSA